MSFIQESLHESASLYQSGIEHVKRQIKDLKTENASYKTKMASLESEFEAQKESNDSLLKSIANLECEKSALIEDLEETEGNLQKVNLF